jgi:hypothetical protein
VGSLRAVLQSEGSNDVGCVEVAFHEGKVGVCDSGDHGTGPVRAQSWGSPLTSGGASSRAPRTGSAGSRARITQPVAQTPSMDVRLGGLSKFILTDPPDMDITFQVTPCHRQGTAPRCWPRVAVRRPTRRLGIAGEPPREVKRDLILKRSSSPFVGSPTHSEVRTIEQGGM